MLNSKVPRILQFQFHGHGFLLGSSNACVENGVACAVNERERSTRDEFRAAQALALCLAD